MSKFKGRRVILCQIFFTESALNPHPKRFLRPYPLLMGFLIGGSWVLKETPKKGGIIDFNFADMRVVESKSKKVVKWKCVKGPKEWVGTDLTFELKAKKDETFVLFTHANWKKPDEFMRHCSTKWATFLLSLKDWLEREEGRPAPYDVKISVGD